MSDNSTDDTGAGSYRRILRSTSIIGSSSVINLVLGLLRMKAAAMLLGPAGIGLIGLLQSLMAVGSSIAGLGISQSGTRQIATASGQANHEQLVLARKALFWGTVILASLGAAVFWLLRQPLAELMLNDASLAPTVGWLGLGVALTVVSASQTSLLNGLMRIGDLARVTIGSAVFAAIAGTGALYLWGEQGITFFVFAAPLGTFLFGLWYLGKIPRPQGRPAAMADLLGEWNTLVRLGFAMMLGGLAWSLAHLLVKTLIQNELGSIELGNFQAGWTIGTFYLGFVLGALSTDYYPRLSAVIGDHTQANTIINQQTEVVVLLVGPVLLGMLGLTPWVIQVLYTAEFASATDLLRWHILGDALKILCWPLTYGFLAAGNARFHLFNEFTAIAIYVASTWLLLPVIGIEAAGLSIVLIFAVLLPVSYLYTRKRSGFAWPKAVWQHASLLLALALAVFVAARWSPWAGAGLGLLSALFFGFYSLAHLGTMMEPGGKLAIITTRSRQLMVKLRFWHES